MLLALTVLFFALGFSTAIFAGKDPATTRTSLTRFLNRLRSLLVEAKQTGDLSLPLKQVRQDLANDEGAVGRRQSEDVDRLMTRKQIEETYEFGSWQREAYENFKHTLLARHGKTFPCIYATMGFRGNEHLYIFLDSDNPSAPRNVRQLGPAMRSYLSRAKALGANTSLVIFCAPSEELASVENYNRRFWDFLRGLRYLDPEAWPVDVPTTTSSENWTFCFEGQPLFPIALTPAHDKRKSRFAPNLTIAMQPKWVLDQLLSTPEKRESATNKVRKLLREYDEIDVSPDLTQYGVPGTTESRQLCLLDENVPSECPYIDFDR